MVVTLLEIIVVVVWGTTSVALPEKPSVATMQNSDSSHKVGEFGAHTSGYREIDA